MAELATTEVPRGLFSRAWRKVERELAALDQAASALGPSPRASTLGEDARRPDHGALITFVVAALCLTLMEYLAGPRTLADLADALHDTWPTLPAWYELRASRWAALLDLTLWVTTRALGFIVLPGLASRFLLKRRMRTLGLALPAHVSHLKAYLWLFLWVLPLLIMASLRPEFRSYYPFYRRAGESWLDLLLWEGLYAFQFFCVEFFFRGFLLSGTYARLGSLAVFAAMIPYCMVHFTKPVLEVLGAIPAGLVLGVLALRTGSIWGGVLLHVAVAWTMDALALAHGAGLPARFWPQ